MDLGLEKVRMNRFRKGRSQIDLAKLIGLINVNNHRLRDQMSNLGEIIQDTS